MVFPFKARDSFSENAKKLSSMANETIGQNSYIQETQEVDDGWESIPHEDSAIAQTLKLKVKVGGGVEYSSTQPRGENQPLSDTYSFSTPAPTSAKGGVKAKSQLSGLPSALTPILKYLNIGNKRQSPGFIKLGNANSQPNLDSSSNRSGQSLTKVKDSVSLLEDEYMPEVTLLDVTCDSTLQVTKYDSAIPDSVPTTAETSGLVRPSFPTLQPSSRCNITQMTNVTLDDPPESTFAPLCWLDDRFFPEITLLEVTQDSEVSPGMERCSVNVTQDISPEDAPNVSMASLELSGQPAADSNKMDHIQTGDLSTTLEDKATRLSSFSEKSNCVEPNVTKASLELTQDISMSSLSCNGQSSLEPSGLNIGNITKDTVVTHPVNVTHAMNSSSDTSAQSTKTQLDTTSDMQCDTSSKTVTSDVLTEPVVISKTEESPTSCNSKCSSLSPKTALNNSFTVAQLTKLSSTSDLSSTSQTPQNVTLDLALSTVNTPKAESEAKDPAVSLSGNIIQSFPEMNTAGVKPGGLCDAQNTTFDVNSLQKSSGNSTLGEAAAATFSLQDSTFDTRPHQQNGTITLSETSSSNSHHHTVDQTPSSKVSDTTSPPQHPTSDVHPSEVSSHNGLASVPDPNGKKADNPESTLDTYPAVEKASEPGQGMTKDSPGLPVDRETEGLSDTSVIQHRALEGYKASSFNLDGTLDLTEDALITSTPMPNCKMFNFSTERDTGKIFGATKKLYGDAPCKPDGQVTSEIPSNIICDRKTFLTKPTAKSFLPSSKPASHLLKYKPASTFPGKSEAPTSGLPMTRQRIHAEALRSTAACDVLQVASGTSGSYNLRTTTTESKQPITGLRKPQSSGLPSNIQRATVGLRPLSARSKAPAPSTGKLQAPTANPLSKISQAKKHPMNKAEALQVVPKKRKIDALLPSSNAEASTFSCEAANRAKNLKQHPTCQRDLPAQKDSAAQANTSGSSASSEVVTRARVLKQPATSHRALTAKPQTHGCGNCAALEQQLKVKSEEIRRLKKELEKFCKKDKC